MKLSLIIPTYNEKENIKILISGLREEFSRNKIDGEIIVVDDNSPDGTGAILDELKSQYNNLVVVHRGNKSGLSSAVIDGFKFANGDVLGVMDADLSHPIEKIHEIYNMIVINGADLVVGSRYVKDGKIEGWVIYRRFLSFGATLLARIYTKVKDPMSGFFMFKREFLVNKNINPKGFKILLELLIKLDFKKIVEIPITFVNRTKGKSKAGIKEIIYYFNNLVNYIPYKKKIIIEFFKFSCVGLLGTFINLGVLYLFTEYYQIYYVYSSLYAFVVAVTVNFVLNKIWTFDEGIFVNLIKKYFKFLIISMFSLLINIILLVIFTEIFGIYYIFSQIIGIGVSLIINFIGNKIWTFWRQ